jgi:hypothetical protein
MACSMARVKSCTKMEMFMLGNSKGGSDMGKGLTLGKQGRASRENGSWGKDMVRDSSPR